MKKIIFVVGSALVLILLLSWPWRIRVSKEVVIRASLFDVGPQLTDVANWRHWYPDAARHRFVITANNPAAVVAKVDDNDYLSLTAVPDRDINYTRVAATRVISLGEWIKGDVMEVGLDSLKRFLEDPVTHYGFDISIQPVTDTLVMTRRDTVAPAFAKVRLDTLRNQLMDYLGKNGVLPSAFDLYTVNEPVGKDRVLVAVGIPVSRALPDENGVELLKFPANGLLLVGRYSSNALPDLRRAMDKYMLDQHLTKVALPFTKGHALYYPIY
ncbi:MAG TPA: hypothetical protein VGN00_27985 [Puia sp.]|jgi:hypothetical protein